MPKAKFTHEHSETKMHSGTYHKPKRKQQPAPETASQAESEKPDLWEVMRPAHVRHASVATEFESVLKDPIASAFHRGVVAGIEIAMDRLSKERVVPSDQQRVKTRKAIEDAIEFVGTDRDHAQAFAIYKQLCEAIGRAP